MNKNNSITFQKWNGLDGIANYINFRTNCKPFSGAGINYRKEEYTTILRSVDDTYYYSDDLSNIKYPKYTLFLAIRATTSLKYLPIQTLCTCVDSSDFIV